MQKRIQELTELITKYNRAYYEQNAPLISDVEYDVLFKELAALENEYPEFRLADSPTENADTSIKIAPPTYLTDLCILKEQPQKDITTWHM